MVRVRIDLRQPVEDGFNLPEAKTSITREGWKAGHRLRARLADRLAIPCIVKRGAVVVPARGGDVVRGSASDVSGEPATPDPG